MKAIGYIRVSTKEQAREGDSLIPDKKEQELIRVVNRLYRRKKNLSFIVKRLTELGYQTRQGKNFKAQQVKRIIKDYEPVYSHNGSRKAGEIKEFILSIA